MNEKLNNPNAFKIILVNPKMAGGSPHPCGFFKKKSSKERVRLWFFVNFNIIISHIFRENFIEMSEVVYKYEDFLCKH